MEQFTFDEFFQQHYIAFLLRDPVFYQHVRSDVSPELFQSEQAQKVVRLILGWAEEHATPPGELIYTEIDLLRQQAVFDDKEINTLKLYIKKLLDAQLQNRKFILDQHDRFMAHQKLLSSFPKFTESVRKGRYDQARQILTEVVTFKSAYGSIGGFHDPDPSERILRREAEEKERFWLLIPEIDEVVDGLKRKQVGVWMSQRSSAGKTAALLHQAKAFAMQGKNVLFITLEDAREEIEDKLDMTIAGITKVGLRDRALIHKKLLWLFRGSRRIHIVEFPPGSTVADLRRYTNFLANAENWVPDAVLVDYADLLAPEDKRLAGDLFGAGNEVYTLLSAWAKEDVIGIWTAAQGTRGAITEAHADQEHMGMSLAKVWIAHQILSINRTAEEQKEGITQIYVVKNKGGRARFSRTIHSDFDRMHFYCHQRSDE